LNFIKLEKLVASHKIDETFYFYQKIYFIYFLIIIFEKKNHLKKIKKIKNNHLSHFLEMIFVILGISFDDKSLIMVIVLFKYLSEKKSVSFKFF